MKCESNSIPQSNISKLDDEFRKLVKASQVTSSEEGPSDDGEATDDDTMGDSFQNAERDGSNMEHNLMH